MNIALEILKLAFEADLNVYVWYIDDESVCTQATSAEQAWSWVEELEETKIQIGREAMWVTAYGVADDETVLDHTTGGWIEATWQRLYDSL